MGDETLGVGVIGTGGMTGRRVERTVGDNR